MAIGIIGALDTHGVKPTMPGATGNAGLSGHPDEWNQFLSPFQVAIKYNKISYLDA